MTTTTNTIQTINKTTLSLIQSIELTAIECFKEGMIGCDVYNHLTTMYGDVLGNDLIRMVVNSATIHV